MTADMNIQDPNDPNLTLEELRAIARKYHALLDSNNLGYVILTEDGTVLDANPQYVCFSGHKTLAEIVGRNITEWTASEDEEPLIKALTECLANGSLQGFNTRHIRGDGTLVALSFDASVEHADNGRRILALCRDNTAQRTQLDTWAHEKLYIDAIFESVPFLLYEYDDQLRLIRWNKRAEKLTGFSAEELYRKPLVDWFAEEDLPKIVEGLQHVRETGYATVEVPLQLKDGSHVPYYFTAVRLDLDGKEFFTGIGVDLSELKRAEEAVKAERDRAWQYLQVAEVILIMLDNDGNIALINRKGCEILGYDELELLGRSWFKLCVPAAESESVAAVFKEIIDGNITPYEYFENAVVTKDGRRRLMAWHNAYIRDTFGNISGTLSSGEDITDRRAAEDELARANEQLTVERETLHKKNIALQEILHQVGEGRKNTGVQIQSNIEKIVLPILHRLATRLDAQGKNLLSLAETSLHDVVSPYVSSLEAKSRNLTSREIELCDFIRRGLGSKEIANIRGCSVQTVIKQRKLVRKKLGISGKDVNFQSFVSNLMLKSNKGPDNTK